MRVIVKLACVIVSNSLWELKCMGCTARGQELSPERGDWLNWEGEEKRLLKTQNNLDRFLGTSYERWLKLERQMMRSVSPTLREKQSEVDGMIAKKIAWQLFWPLYVS